MAGILYQDLGKSIALRAGQLVDAIDASALETSFIGALANIMGGVEIPLTALRSDILNNEAVIAAMIGNSSNNLLRMALMGEASVSSGGDIPLVTSTSSRPFVGKFDGLFSSGTGNKPLTLMEKHVVLNRLRNSGTFYKLDLNGYFEEGTKVFFQTNASTAIFRGCAWKRSTAETSYDQVDLLGVSVLPQQCAVLWQNMVLADIAQENFFMSEAARFGSLAEQAADAIGLVMEPAMTPDAVVTNRENRNATSENVR